MDDNGLLRRLERSYIRYEDKCTAIHNQQVLAKTIRIEETMAAFIILAVGISISFIMLFLERFIKRSFMIVF